MARRSSWGGGAGLPPAAGDRAGNNDETVYLTRRDQLG